MSVAGVVSNGVVVPSSPLPEGADVLVVVLPKKTPTSMLDLLDSLPPLPATFPNWSSYEQHLREEKAAWDR